MKTQLYILGSFLIASLSASAQDWATVYTATLNDMAVHNAAIYGTTSGSGPVKSTNGTDWETIDEASEQIVVEDVCYECVGEVSTIDVCYGDYEDKATFDSALQNFEDSNFDCALK